MVIVEYAVSCDGCYRPLFDGPTYFFTAADAKLAAWQQGWLEIDGEHHCPSCADHEPIKEGKTRARELKQGTGFMHKKKRDKRGRPQRTFDSNDQVRPLPMGSA